MKRMTTIIVLLSMLAAVTSGAMEIKDLPKVFKDAKVGEWATFEMPSNMKMKQEIVKVTADKITIKSTTYMNGKEISSTESTAPRNPKPAFIEAKYKKGGAKTPKISKGKLAVKGKDMECFIVEAEMKGMKSKTYISADIPVTGLVQVDINGVPTMKLVDYGTK